MTPRSPSSSGSLAAIAAADSRDTLNVPNAFIAIVSTNTALSCGVPSRPSVRPPPVAPPATLTTSANRPTDCAAAIAAATSSSSLTSPAAAPAPSPSSFARAAARSPSRSKIATPMPMSTKRRTVAAPKSPAPPVTSADRPVRSIASDRNRDLHDPGQVAAHDRLHVLARQIRWKMVDVAARLREPFRVRKVGTEDQVIDADRVDQRADVVFVEGRDVDVALEHLDWILAEQVRHAAVDIGDVFHEGDDPVGTVLDRGDAQVGK